MNTTIAVNDEQFQYLKLQKGSLYKLARMREKWHAAYEADLRESFRQIRPFLPATCSRLLDIGSGLGGIDILIGRHYEELGQGRPFTRLLDGIDDVPVLRLHRQTFNSMRVAHAFQIDNGLAPANFGYFSTDVSSFAQPFDLVVSFGSWCFHYPAHYYLPALSRGGLHAGSVVIVDVRTNKPEYMRDLETCLELVTMVAVKEKWSRCVFRPRP